MTVAHALVLESPKIGAFDLGLFERARVLAAADAFLNERPITVTDAHCDRSAGGRHDFFSEGDYWWPDPANPGGPYIRRDGLTNPENFTAHREAMRRMAIHVPALTAAFVLTGEERYARHAGLHLAAWFANDATHMTPHLEYGQAIHGVCTGRGIGLVDTVHLAEVAVAARLLIGAGAIDPGTGVKTTAWFREFMQWMRTSSHGIAERDTGNNHTTCWVLQVAAYAALCGDRDALAECRERYRAILLMQMDADGSFPLELERTRPYNYSIFNLDVMAALCQLFATIGESEWTSRSPGGLTILDAMEFLFPALINKAAWRAAPDVSLFDRLPVRSPMLIFGALAFDRPGWLALWRKLDPDPKEDELVRNHPVRQPLLWYLP